MNYGWVTKKDAETLEIAMGSINHRFPEGVINTTEIGVRDGKTSRAIHEWFTSRSRVNFHTGIDNNHDLEVTPPFNGCNLIIGDSTHVSDEIRDNSQHLIFDDGNHSLFNTTADFLLYKNKVVVGGLFLFHDVSPHIPEKKDYQDVGSRDNPYDYISCREAITRLGLLDNKFPGWELVMIEYDKTSDTGGIAIFKRIK